MAVATPSNLTPELVKEYWDSQLEMEILQSDILSKLTSRMDGTKGTSRMVVPEDALIASLGLPTNSERTAHLGFVHALQGTPQEGTGAIQLGNEETLRTKYMDARFNEFSHAAAGWNYGMRAYEGKYLGMYGDADMSMITKLLGKHAEETLGLYKRQSLLQRYSRNLTSAPHNLTYQWNPHFYVKGLYDHQQPAYNTNNTTYQNNIITALQTAGTGIGTAFDPHFVLAAKARAKATHRIEPVRIGGKARYVLTIPTQQAVWFRTMDVTGSGGYYWKDAAALAQEGISFDLLIGEVDNVLIVEDERAPTLTITGSASPFGLSAGYLHPGNNDDRDTSSSARECGFFLGKGPLVEWWAERIHHKFDDYNYQKWQGKGYFGMVGYQLRMYDQTTPSNTSLQQNSSMVCVFGRNAMYN